MKTSFFLVSLLGAGAALAQPSLTVYNQDFAVVRDTLEVTLIPGVNELRYSGATAAVEPESVILRDPTGKIGFQILEQSYRNDPADEALLLKLYEGKEIEFEVEAGEGRKTLVKGKIVRAGNPSPIIELDKRLRFELPGRPWFPALGDNTILQPTLSWQLNAAANAQGPLELAYVTGGLSWSADYNLVLPEKGDVFDMVAWVSVRNGSGKTFEEANLKLMAGDVAKVEKGLPWNRSGRDMMALAAAPPMEDQVTEKTFDDFHLYSVARPVTLLDKETKQVEFARATGVKSERFYVYDGSGLSPYGGSLPLYGEGDYGGAEGNKKVATFVEFKNSKENQLGIALPKGRVRFYRADGEQLQFTGEVNIDHTAKEELLRFQTGFAFDLVGERKRMNFTRNERRNEATESFEITVRNRKEEASEIRVVEHLARWANWEVTEKSQEFVKTNAQTIEFRVPLAAGEEKVVGYTVRYTW
jgi:hypothetical protein